MRVAAYTGGEMVPSARARVRQYIVPLDRHGISVKEYPLPMGNILPRQRSLRPLWMAATAVSRSVALAYSWKADVTWISRQLLPAFIPIHGLAKAPRILDVDDAVWLNTGGQRARALAHACDLVVCGNSYLADYFSSSHRNVTVIPTAVNTNWYRPQPFRQDAGPGSEHDNQADREHDLATPQELETREDELVLGWTGTSGNFPFLTSIEPALARVMHQCARARLLIVADRPPAFRHLPSHRIDFERWTPRSELAAFARMSIGLMPLADTEWCNGKCSYKMLCYMSAALPVVVTGAGMNREVLAHGNVGLAAETQQHWVDALLTLLENPALRRRMGAAGRTVVEEHYSLHRLARQYALLFQSLAGQSARGNRSPAVNHPAHQTLSRLASRPV